MSKGQKRSNRELKKPKQTKPKTAVTPTASTIQTKLDGFTRGKKKW